MYAQRFWRLQVKTRIGPLPTFYDTNFKVWRLINRSVTNRMEIVKPTPRNEITVWGSRRVHDAVLISWWVEKRRVESVGWILSLIGRAWLKNDMENKRKSWGWKPGIWGISTASIFCMVFSIVFLSGHSCLKNLLSTLSTVTQLMYDGGTSTWVSWTSARSSMPLNFVLFLPKLLLLGCLSWWLVGFWSYLANRTIYVRIGSMVIEEDAVHS